MSHWDNNSAGRHRRAQTEESLASDYVPSHAATARSGGLPYGSASQFDQPFPSHYRAVTPTGTPTGHESPTQHGEAHAFPHYPVPAYARVRSERVRLYLVLGLIGVLVVGASIAAIAVNLSGGSSSGYRTAAAALARQLGCTGVHASTPASGAVTVDLGIHPREEVLCTLDGQTIDITTWANAGDQTAAEARGRSLLHGNGEEAYVARGPGWLAGVDDDKGTAQLAVQQRIALRIATQLHGTVQHWS